MTDRQCEGQSNWILKEFKRKQCQQVVAFVAQYNISMSSCEDFTNIHIVIHTKVGLEWAEKFGLFSMIFKLHLHKSISCIDVRTYQILMSV